MKICKKCLMPDTRPGIRFNEKGVCQACVNHEKKKTTDWKERQKELDNLCDLFRRKPGEHKFDCMIAVSGGKDSHYQVHVMKEEMGMNPLLVSVEDNFPMTEAGKNNIRNISEEFGCQIISCKPNIKDQKIAMDYTFRKYGMPTYYVDRLIYTFPLYMSYFLKIPLLIYGENVSYEYGGIDDEENPSATRQIYNGVASGIDLSGLGIDMTMLNAPTPAMLERIHPIYLSYFKEWNSVNNYKFAKSRGFHDLIGEWNRSNHVEDFDQIDTRAYLIHPWMKYPKFGHAFATDYCSRMIRYEIWTREEALRELEGIEEEPDPLMIRDFCEFMGYSDREFWKIVDKHYNPELFGKKDGKWRLKDM